jgi:hypothetical protein
MRASISGASRSGFFASAGADGIAARRGSGDSTGGNTAMRRMRRDSRSVERLLCRLPGLKLQPDSKKKNKGSSVHM